MFISSLALAQQQVGIVGIEQFTDYITRLAQIEPTILDKFNSDKAASEYLERCGAPVGLLHSDEEAAATRQARDAAAEQDRTATMLSEGATGADKVGNTPMNTGSALDTVMGGLQNVQ